MEDFVWGSLRGEPVRYIDRQGVAALASSLPAAYILCSIDGSNIGSESELLERFATAMKFPEYFGRNWNALKDCLSDLAWIPARGYVILLSDASGYLRTRPSDFKILSEIVNTVSTLWEERGVEFVLVVETGDRPSS